MFATAHVYCIVPSAMQIGILCTLLSLLDRPPNRQPAKPPRCSTPKRLTPACPLPSLPLPSINSSVHSLPSILPSIRSSTRIQPTLARQHDARVVWFVEPTSSLTRLPTCPSIHTYIHTYIHTSKESMYETRRDETYQAKQPLRFFLPRLHVCMYSAEQLHRGAMTGNAYASTSSSKKVFVLSVYMYVCLSVCLRCTCHAILSDASIRKSLAEGNRDCE
ncbi:hypothetical protein BKA80DRAFT_87004 [Phyllosticta citrichinensis]